MDLCTDSSSESSLNNLYANGYDDSLSNPWCRSTWVGCAPCHIIDRAQKDGVTTTT